jgi:hypothetical protein
LATIRLSMLTLTPRVLRHRLVWCFLFGGGFVTGTLRRWLPTDSVDRTASILVAPGARSQPEAGLAISPQQTKALVNDHFL